MRLRTTPSEGAGQRLPTRRVPIPFRDDDLLVSDRVCWAILAVISALAAGLILWLDRGTTYNVDQIRVFLSSPDLGAQDVLEPQNGNLGATTRLVYKALLETFGAGFLSFRIVHVAVLVLAAALFYALVKRWLGAAVALAPTSLLLALGSDWGHVATPLGFTVASSIAAGLGSLLCLERRDRAGDILASVLLVVSIATFSTGIAFLVGAAISVLIRDDRWRRAWIFLVPLGLYLTWWLFAPGGGGGSPTQDPDVGNLLRVPGYVFTLLSAALAAVTGLGYEFTIETPPEVGLGPGPILALIALTAVIFRIRHGNLPAALAVTMGILLTYWILASLVVEPGFGARLPTKSRYLYPGAVMLLLVVATGAVGLRLTRTRVTVLLCLLAVALPTNLALMRDGAAWFRESYSRPARAQFAMLDLAGDHVARAFDPRRAVADVSTISTPAGAYLSAVEDYGSPGFTLEELASQPEHVQVAADRILAAALRLRLAPTESSGPTARCQRVAIRPGALASVGLPPGGAVLRLDTEGTAAISLGRFSDSYPVSIGSLVGQIPTQLRVPPDSSAEPWQVALTGVGSVAVCPLPRTTG